MPVWVLKYVSTTEEKKGINDSWVEKIYILKTVMIQELTEPVHYLVHK